jgi:prefoldin alpha subunit
MDQEKIMEIAGIERQAREMEDQLQMIDAQIVELENFRKTVTGIKESKEREMFSSLGGRVYLKSKIEVNDKLFVEVGAGVIVVKSPDETLEIVSGQIERMRVARHQIDAHLEINQKKLEEFINSVQQG